MEIRLTGVVEEEIPERAFEGGVFGDVIIATEGVACFIDETVKRGGVALEDGVAFEDVVEGVAFDDVVEGVTFEDVVALAGVLRGVALAGVLRSVALAGVLRGVALTGVLRDVPFTEIFLVSFVESSYTI